jgi:hypothetical protein
MNNNPNNLPNSDNLNISAFSELFNDTTNSYKYLFFLAVLDILEERHFDIYLGLLGSPDILVQTV